MRQTVSRAHVDFEAPRDRGEGNRISSTSQPSHLDAGALVKLPGPSRETGTGSGSGEPGLCSLCESRTRSCFASVANKPMTTSLNTPESPDRYEFHRK